MWKLHQANMTRNQATFEASWLMLNKKTGATNLRPSTTHGLVDLYIKVPK
jgi:hypothetical protein